MMIRYSVRKKTNNICLICMLCLYFVGLCFASNSQNQDWHGALAVLRQRNVTEVYINKAHSNDNFKRRATFYDYAWLKQADTVFSFILSQRDSKAKLQAIIKKDLESSHNYPYIVSLSALSAGFCSESDASFVSSVQSILSHRIFEAKPENRWHFIYAVEQTIQCGHYSYSEITEISKLVHSWRELELDNNASFQLKHLLFSITGQISGYFQIDESTRHAIDEVFGNHKKRGALKVQPQAPLPPPPIQHDSVCVEQHHEKQNQ